MNKLRYILIIKYYPPKKKKQSINTYNIVSEFQKCYAEKEVKLKRLHNVQLHLHYTLKKIKR